MTTTNLENGCGAKGLNIVLPIAARGASAAIRTEVTIPFENIIILSQPTS
jgi:hypothetical protein